MMHTQRELLQDRVIRRAEQFAHERHYTGPGRFQKCDVDKALAELSPEERQIERGLTGRWRESGSQQARASKHLAEEIAKHRAYGYSHADAIKRALTEEHPKLKARRLGIDPIVPLTDGQRAMCRMFSVSSPPAKVYATGGERRE